MVAIADDEVELLILDDQTPTPRHDFVSASNGKLYSIPTNLGTRSSDNFIVVLDSSTDVRSTIFANPGTGPQGYGTPSLFTGATERIVSGPLGSNHVLVITPSTDTAQYVDEDYLPVPTQGSYLSPGVQFGSKMYWTSYVHDYILVMDQSLNTSHILPTGGPLVGDGVTFSGLVKTSPTDGYAISGGGSPIFGVTPYRLLHLDTATDTATWSVFSLFEAINWTGQVYGGNGIIYFTGVYSSNQMVVLAYNIEDATSDYFTASFVSHGRYATGVRNLEDGKIYYAPQSTGYDSAGDVMVIDPSVGLLSSAISFYPSPNAGGGTYYTAGAFSYSQPLNTEGFYAMQTAMNSSRKYSLKFNTDSMSSEGLDLYTIHGVSIVPSYSGLALARTTANGVMYAIETSPNTFQAFSRILKVDPNGASGWRIGWISAR